MCLQRETANKITTEHTKSVKQEWLDVLQSVAADSAAEIAWFWRKIENDVYDLFDDDVLSSFDEQEAQSETADETSEYFNKNIHHQKATMKAAEQNHLLMKDKQTVTESE